MKMNEINKIYSDKVAEYLAKGYTIHPVSMGGSQGEICKIDLYKGDELIRIWMSDESCRWSDPNCYREGYRAISVGKWMYPTSMSDRYNDTVWYKELEVLEEIRFYPINNGKCYIDDLQVALNIQNLRRSRYRDKSYVNGRAFIVITDEKKAIARKYLMRKHGYKRVNSDKIGMRIDEYGKYHIMYNNRDYVLK